MSLPNDLLTLDEKTLQPPESRVGSISGVRSRIAELRKGDSGRSLNRAMMQGLIDGQKPYDQSKMDEAGRGDDANINFREAEGKVATGTTPYYELDFGVPRAINLDVYFDAPRQKCFEWAEKIANRYTETLWGWKSYKIHRQFSHYQKVVFGRGPIMWDTKTGWHHKAVKDDSVWVADDAKCDLDDLPEMAIPGAFNPVKLWKLIQKAGGNSKDKEQRLKSGWDVDMAKQAIMQAAPDTMQDSFKDHWMQYETTLRRGDVQWNNKTAKIKYTDYLVKEFTGKITHCIVLDNTPEREGSDEDDFLFKKVGRFESFHQVINPFFFDAGPEAEWYGVKGLGPKIFDSCDLSNRFWCTVINGALASCGIPLQAANAQAMQKIFETPITRAGGMTFIPDQWNVQQINMRGAFDGPLEVIRGVNNILESNTGQYQQLDTIPQPTLGQEQIQVSARTALTRGAYDRHYDQLDDMHLETVRRMFDKKITKDDPGGEEALEMRKKLIDEDLVPEEVLDFKNFCNIKSVRSVGYGSPENQQIVFSKLVGMLGTMDEEGRRNALRSMGANLVGQSNVDRFWKPFEEMGVPNDQEAWATVENNILRMPTAQLEVTPAQNPAVHFVTHFKFAMQSVQALQAGQTDPMQVVTLLDNVGPHNHLHLDEMAGDETRKPQYEQFLKMHLMLAKITDGLKKQVAQAQAAQQQPNPQPDPNLVAKLAEVAANAQIEEKQMLLQENRKDRKLEHDQALKDRKLGGDMMRKNVELMQSANGR